VESQYLLEVRLEREGVPAFSEYPFNLNAVRKLERLRFHPAMTYVVGENGSGKSTLLEAIAVALGFNPEGGTRNFGFSTRKSHSSLWEHISLAKGIRSPEDGFFLRAESFFNVATNIEDLDREPAPAPPIINSYGGRSLHEQSHGESFMALAMNRFGGKGLYILDEPEAALSPTRQLALLARIHELIQDDSQFIIATHSPILMAYPNATLYLLEEDGPREVPYTETEHFEVTRDFLNNHESMLKILMDDE
jgi:predicted ATPase